MYVHSTVKTNISSVM